MIAQRARRWGWALGLVSCSLLAQAQTVAEAPPAAAVAAPASVLVPFGSEDGLARLARAAAKADFAALANQFEPQSNAAFCGPTSAAIVLNAAHAGAPDLPRDRSRLRADDLRFLPPGFDPSVPRFTQDSVVERGLKTRARVLGEPVVVDGRTLRDGGYQLRQLDEMLRANGAVTRMEVVDDAKPLEAVRADLAASLQQTGAYVLVNYRRELVGQRGGGHISPLGAYDAATDSFLVMDVNPAAAPWVWMPSAVLARGMRSFDTVENRGYIVVRAR